LHAKGIYQRKMAEKCEKIKWVNISPMIIDALE